MDNELISALSGLTRSVAAFREDYDRRLGDLEGKSDRPERPPFSSFQSGEERRAIDQFVRRGHDIHNALETGDGTKGGFGVTPVFAGSIVAKLPDSAPMLSHVRVITMGSGSNYQEPRDNSDTSIAWAGETEAREESDAATLELLDVPLDEMTKTIPITQRLIDDGDVDIVAYVGEKVSTAFGLGLDAAIVAGDGVKKPRGFLNYNVSANSDGSRAAQTIQYVPSGAASALTADSVINLFYALRAPYRANAKFAMSSDTFRQVRLLKDSNDNYLVGQSLTEKSGNTLLGKEIIFDESMPSVAAGKSAVAVADWRAAYTVITRPGIRFLRDPFSRKPYVLVYCTARFGGQLSGDWDSIKVMRTGTS